MSKVDKLATEKYPPQLTSEFEFGTEDLNEGLRRAFKAGYEQGSKAILEKACEWIKRTFFSGILEKKLMYVQLILVFLKTQC